MARALSGAALARLRAINEANMPAIATIQSVAVVSDDAGGHSEEWSTATTTTARIALLGNSGAERAAAAGLEAVEAFTLSFPTGTSITEAQRVTIDGRTFHVVAVLGPTTYESGVRVVAAERGNG